MRPLGGFRLPSGYTELEYLESPATPDNHVLAYFKLPLPHVTSLDDSIMYETEHMFTEYGSSLQGEGIADNYTTFFLGNNISQAGKYVAIDGVEVDGIFFGNWNHKFSCSNGEWHTVLHYLGNSQNSKWQLSVDDVLQVDKAVQFDSVKHYKEYFFVFGTNQNHALCGKKRYAKIWVNGKQIYDLIPVLDETGAPGFYDRKNKNMYYNAGEGDFIYPEPESTYSLRRAAPYVPEFAMLTPRGVRRLYRTPVGYAGSITEYAAEHGFKRLVETEQPAEGYWSPVWRETLEELRLEWQEMSAPEETKERLTE